MLILKNGVTITIVDEDKVSVNGKVCKIEDLPNKLVIDGSTVNVVRHENKQVKVDYYLPAEVISWCYLQEVKDEPITD
jgi:hypothetical protein